QASQARYQLGGTAPADHVTSAYGYVSAEVNVAAVTGATVISVDDGSVFTNGYNIGVVLDDGSMHWTTINAHSAFNVTLTVGLPSAAAAGNAVFSYQTKTGRLLRIVDARVKSIDSGTETPLMMTARVDYNMLSNKSEPGTINQIFYDRQLSAGYINVWQ